MGKSLVVSARYLTVISWLTYPGVYIIKSMGLAGNIATTYEQVGYSVADVVAKAVFGVLIWAIAAGKSAGGVAGLIQERRNDLLASTSFSTIRLPIDLLAATGEMCPLVTIYYEQRYQSS